MPKLGKGTERIKILLLKTSKSMQKPLIPMFFPIFGVHICGAEFQYPDFSWKEPCGIMANLVAKSGDNKSQLTINGQALDRRPITLPPLGGGCMMSDGPARYCPRSFITSCPWAARTSASTIFRRGNNPALLHNNPPLFGYKDGLIL